MAFPVLKELEIPATLYLTTFYVGYNRPVFDTMLRYLLWKSIGRKLSLRPVFSEAIVLSRANLDTAASAVEKFVRKKQLTAIQKDGLLGRIASELKVDYGDLLRTRLLHLMNPEEVREVAEDVDIQLHTHRHRISRQEISLRREIDENRIEIESLTGRQAAHFCYPGGNYLPQFRRWLFESGVLSATTSEPGLCSATSDPFFLPRLVDTSTLTSAEFAGWVSGFSQWLPRRKYKAVGGQFLEDWSPLLSSTESKHAPSLSAVSRPLVARKSAI